MKTLLSLFQRILPLIVFVVLFHGSMALAQCPGVVDGPDFPCTPEGAAEAAQAQSLLNSGMDVTAATIELNNTRPASYSGLSSAYAGGCEAYPSGPYVGCIEYYMALYDPNDLSRGWEIIMRCNGRCTDYDGCVPGTSTPWSQRQTTTGGNTGTPTGR